MEDDRTLVEAVLARRHGAFEQLVARHQRLVWHLVHRMVQDPEDTRELSQEVFLRVYQRLHQFRYDSALSTWIGRVAFSIATRHLQRKRLPIVEPDAEDDDGDTPLARVSDGFDLEAAAGDDEMNRHLAAALGTLSPLQRTLVTLFHLDELGIAEVASIVGLPEGTVKSYLFRARLKLRQQLEHLTGAIA